jgi:hypothetical protein
VLDYTTFAIVLATMADTTALYALRRRQPDRHRPYRAWGYPLVPALYQLGVAPPVDGGGAAARVRHRPRRHRHRPAVLLLVRARRPEQLASVTSVVKIAPFAI